MFKYICFVTEYSTTVRRTTCTIIALLSSHSFSPPSATPTRTTHRLAVCDDFILYTILRFSRTLQKVNRKLSWFTLLRVVTFYFLFITCTVFFKTARFADSTVMDPQCWLQYDVMINETRRLGKRKSGGNIYVYDISYRIICLSLIHI